MGLNIDKSLMKVFDNAISQIKTNDDLQEVYRLLWHKKNELKQIVELVQCNKCGAREWYISDVNSNISHIGDGCWYCDNGVFLLSRECRL
jgi:hypothetical protein